MPIRPENRDRYPKDWPAISQRIRERDGQRCKWCKAPNGEVICRGTDGTYMLMHGDVFCAETGEHLGRAKGSEYPASHFVKVVLTVAHLDHTPENVEDDNLAALCQRCHLTYDRHQHAANRRETIRARKASADLFEGAA